MDGYQLAVIRPIMKARTVHRNTAHPPAGSDPKGLGQALANFLAA